MVSFDYHDNLLKRRRRNLYNIFETQKVQILKKKKEKKKKVCTIIVVKRIWTTLNRAMENTYRNCFIFGGDKFSSTNFREQIRHYTISQNNNIFPHIAWVVMVLQVYKKSQDNR